MFVFAAPIRANIIIIHLLVIVIIKLILISAAEIQNFTQETGDAAVDFEFVHEAVISARDPHYCYSSTEDIYNLDSEFVESTSRNRNGSENGMIKRYHYFTNKNKSDA